MGRNIYIVLRNLVFVYPYKAVARQTFVKRTGNHDFVTDKSTVYLARAFVKYAKGDGTFGYCYSDVLCRSALSVAQDAYESQTVPTRALLEATYGIER